MFVHTKHKCFRRISPSKTSDVCCKCAQIGAEGYGGGKEDHTDKCLQHSARDNTRFLCNFPPTCHAESHQTVVPQHRCRNSSGSTWNDSDYDCGK